MGFEQILTAVVEIAGIGWTRINSTREQCALFGGESGSTLEISFWALTVMLGLPLVERLIGYDRMDADSKVTAAWYFLRRQQPASF